MVKEMSLLPRLKIINPEINLPERATEKSAGYDLFLPEEVTLAPNEMKKVPMGFAMDMNYNCCAKIYPRSGLSTKRGIILANIVGIIDGDFHGEVCLMLKNTSNEEVVLRKNERVAQMILEYYGVSIQHDEEGNVIGEGWDIVDDLGETERDEIGFGSTGR